LLELDTVVNSASIKEILFGCMKIEFWKKSLPIPTNKSEKTKPKNILNSANINKGKITIKLSLSPPPLGLDELS
jgi:hypothetical protein